jgi:hypothetical protein
MNRLEQLAEEIAAEIVEGTAVADILMEQRERVVDDEAWCAYQRVKIDAAAAGIETALRLLAAARTGTTDPNDLGALAVRLATAWAKFKRRRDRAFDDELRDVAGGGAAA